MTRIERELIDAITAAVEGRQRTRGLKRGDEMVFTCPAHSPDADPSASWNTAKAAWTCRSCGAGGGAVHLAQLLGIDARSKVRNESPRNIPPRSSKARDRDAAHAGQRADGGSGSSPPGSRSNTRTGLTLAEYAAAKQLPEGKLLDWGVTQQSYLGAPAVKITYRDRVGDAKASRFRLALEGRDRFRWRNGDKPFLYGLDRLAQAREAGYVFAVEGESDAQTCWHHDRPAIGVPGASNWNEARDAAELDGIPAIYVCIEPDQGGEAVKNWIASSAIRERVRLLTLPVKDVSALHLEDSNTFGVRLEQAMAAAQPWTDIAAAEAAAAARVAEAAAGDLLNAPDLWPRIGHAITARGYAGDNRPPLLGYLGMTSRFLPRPVNIAYVASSAAGKNRAVDAGAELLPPEAVHRMSAGSARALIYDDDEFTNVSVIVEEADAIPDDGPVASAIRAIAEAGVMAYDVVERDESTGKWYTRHIVKPGPTQLTTTSTRSLAYQLGTRVLEVPISDSEDQTRKVMQIHARRAAGLFEEPPDTAPFIALQSWLALAGERRVIVPFAEGLIELIPAREVRMRRDVQALLTCVQTVAFLHQRQRARARGGEVVATFDDYEIVRDLLLPIFDNIAAEGITPAVRQTVEAIKPGEELSLAALASRLTIAKSTASYRVERALAAGVLVNNEPNEKKQKRLARGADLPEARPALPDVADLEVFESSNELPEEYIPPPPPPPPGSNSTNGNAPIPVFAGMDEEYDL